MPPFRAQITLYCGYRKDKNSFYKAFGEVLSSMMASSNGNIFCVTGLLCGEYTGHPWIPRIKASDAEFDVFFDLQLSTVE